MRIVGWKFRLSAAKFFRMMVARDGVEPPTPAPVARAQQEFDKRLADVLDVWPIGCRGKPRIDIMVSESRLRI